MPADLPVPVPPGGEVRNLADPAEGTLLDRFVLRMSYPAGDYDAIVSFYDAWFAGEGIPVEMTTSPRRSRWTWTVGTDAGPKVQEVLLTTGGSFDEGGSTLQISYLPDA